MAGEPEFADHVLGDVALEWARDDLDRKGKKAPPWLGDTTDIVGKYHDKSWAWMCGGGTDGGRHGYMRHVVSKDKCSDEAGKRIRWILKTFYGDEGSDL